MKKLLTGVMIMAAMLTIVGCLTRASASTKKTVYPDGRVEYEAKTSIVGTGDKASEVAGEGMFADGTEEDLGSGFKKGSAKQESTGIGETLNGLGVLMGGMAKFMAASQGVKAAPAADYSADGAAESALQTAAPPGTQASAAKSSEPTALRSIAGTNGAPTVVILGNRANCGYCQSLWNAINGPELSKALDGATVTDADKTENPAAYAKFRPAQSFDWPLALVYDASGNPAGQFTARSYTQAGIETKIKTLLQPGVK